MGSGLFGTSTVPTMGAPQGTTSRSDRRLQVRGGQGRHLGVVAAYAPGGQGRHFGVVVAYMPGDGQTDIWEWLLPMGRGGKATFTIHQETRTGKKGIWWFLASACYFLHLLLVVVYHWCCLHLLLRAFSP